MRRLKCGGCSSPYLTTFLDLGSTPLADNFPTVPHGGERHPLSAMVCESCWLVQLGEIVPDDVLWGGEYGFYTGASPASVGYFAGYAADLIEAYPREPAGFVVEVACNDGTLLRHFDSARKVLGVEPSPGPASVARAAGLHVWGDPFGLATAEAIVSEHGRADLVIANNVLAHVTDLADFTAGLRALLAEDGVLVVEVQYLGDLLLGNGFDLIYHEHRSFFSQHSLSEVLSAAGLTPFLVERTPAQGGSLRVHAGARRHLDTRPTDGEAWLRNLGAYTSMQGRADAVASRLWDLIQAEREAGRRVVGYGAPAKATTLLDFCGITEMVMDAVHDATPSKDGRFMPGTGIPITTQPLPHGSDTTAVLLAHNYLPAVLRREREFIDEGGRFIVPLPVPVVI